MSRNYGRCSAVTFCDHANNPIGKHRRLNWRRRFLPPIPVYEFVMFKILISVLPIVFGLVTASARAADIFVKRTADGQPLGLQIQGEIRPGDYRKLIHFLRQGEPHIHAFLTAVYLDSPGGNLNEAMKLARLIEQSFVSTFVLGGSQCYSACMVLWAAGVQRVVDDESQLGVHRVTVVGSNIGVSRLEQVTRPASRVMEDYMSRLGIPRKIIDKMNETPPTDMYIIDRAWLIHEGIEQASMYRPSFLDAGEKNAVLTRSRAQHA